MKERLSGVSEIYVDIDVKYQDYWDCSRPAKAISGLLAWLGCKFKLYIRRSASGRVHLKLVPARPLSLFEALQVRALLNDDPFRIRQDLARYHETGDITKTGRIFDEKFVEGEVRCAGKWLEIF